MRVIKDQRNLWGTAGNAPNAQRADLWTVSLGSVAMGLQQQLDSMNASASILVGGPSISVKVLNIMDIPVYYAQSVDLPELRVNAEPYRRDSRPVMMPGQDEPLSTIAIKFLMDSPTNMKRSRIYHLLNVWRMFVRAGRGSFSTEPSVPLNKDYRTDFAFDIHLTLFRGGIMDKIANFGDEDSYTSMKDALGDLEICGEYQLKNAWLSSFKMGSLNYPTGNQLLVLDAQLCAETLVDVNATQKAS